MGSLKVVLFDFYDTLALIDVQGVEAARRSLAERCAIDAERMRELWHETGRARVLGTAGSLEEQICAMLTTCGISTQDELLQELAHGDRQAWIDSVRVYDDTLPTLNTLRDHGYQLGLVSNCSCQALDVMKEKGIAPLFDTLALSFELGVMKPDPEIFLAACRGLEVQPDECVFIADGAGGELEAAHALGMRTILVFHQEQNRRHDPPTEYDHRVGSLGEVPPLLAALSSTGIARPPATTDGG